MTLVLVDGSNVARCGAWIRANPEVDEHALRRRLVDAIGSWAAAAGHDAFVTFDGAGPWRPGAVRISDLVEVFGTGGTEGDDVLARRAVTCVRSSRPYWLVTSDRGLQLLAGGGADRVVSADAFVAELDAAADGATSSTVTVDLPPGTTVSETLGDDVRARLERMRRGEI